MSRFGFNFRCPLIVVRQIIGTALGLRFNDPADSQYLLLMIEDF